MSLSYTMRLVCVVVMVAGLVLAASQLILALSARFILRRIDGASARRREQILYLVQIGPALAAAFVGVVLCLPAYLHSEPSRKIESVSLICLLMTAGVGLWCAFAMLRGLRTVLRTLRFTRACRRLGQALAEDGGLTVRSVPGANLPVALIGFLHPFIIVSVEFAGLADRLDPDALALALAHERAHAANRDNWKLLCVAFLPRVDRLLPGGRRWPELWRTAADYAADDDAVQGDPARSMLLAEVLVLAARCAHGPRPATLCTALTHAEAGLAARIDRLTRPQCDASPSGASILHCLAALVLLAGAAFTFSPRIYVLSEWLLHLGAPWR